VLACACAAVACHKRPASTEDASRPLDAAIDALVCASPTNGASCETVVTPCCSGLPPCCFAVHAGGNLLYSCGSTGFNPCQYAACYSAGSACSTLAGSAGTCQNMMFPRAQSALVCQ